MKTQKQTTAYTLTFTFVAAVTFVYLLISIALIPYWQELSGTEIQKWWSGPFTRFSYLMVPVHLLSIITIIIAFRTHPKEEKSVKRLWLIALVTLLICQAFNFTLHGSVYNPALQSCKLDPAIALETFDNWALYHNIRTAFVCTSLICLIGIGITKNKLK